MIVWPASGANADSPGRQRRRLTGHIPWAGRLAVAATVLAVGTGGAVAATPSNAELYRMVKELQAEVKAMRGQTQRASAEAEAARTELESTRRELATARTALQEAGAVRVGETAPGPYGARSTTPWNVGVELLYLRPSTRLDYAFQDPVWGGVEPDVGSKMLAVDPDSELGYRLSAGYQLGGGLDLTGRLGFLSADSSDSAQVAFDPVTGNPRSDIHPIGLHPSPGNEDASSARADFELDYWVADLEVGKSSTGSGGTGMRLFGGLRYASLEESLGAQYFGDRAPPIALDDIALGTPASLKQSSDYTGLGPRLGAMGRWEVGRGFGVFGGVAGSLLLGDLELEYRESQYNNNLARYENRGLKDTDEGHLVPVLESQIGLTWRHETSNVAIEVALGYQFERWFDVVGTLQFLTGEDEPASAPGGASGRNPDNPVAKSVDSLDLHGPFLRVEARF